MKRRNFLQNAGLVTAWAGIAVVVHGCGYGDDDPVTPTLQPGDVAGSISANHGHSVKITAAQLDAAGAVTLNFSGGGHAHAVSLSAAQVGQIDTGQRVTATSTSGNGHTHQVTFS